MYSGLVYTRKMGMCTCLRVCARACFCAADIFEVSPAKSVRKIVTFDKKQKDGLKYETGQKFARKLAAAGGGGVCVCACLRARARACVIACLCVTCVRMYDVYVCSCIHVPVYVPVSAHVYEPVNVPGPVVCA